MFYDRLSRACVVRKWDSRAWELICRVIGLDDGKRYRVSAEQARVACVRFPGVASRACATAVVVLGGGGDLGWSLSQAARVGVCVTDLLWPNGAASSRRPAGFVVDSAHARWVPQWRRVLTAATAACREDHRESKSAIIVAIVKQRKRCIRFDIQRVE